MKFSHKLFKIQAKMSLPVFVLMGSICHLGAMDLDDLERHVYDSASAGTPVQDKDAKRLSVSSDASLTPKSPVVTRVAHNVLPDGNGGDALRRAVRFQDVRNKEKRFTYPKAVQNEKSDAAFSPEFERNLKRAAVRERLFKRFKDNEREEAIRREALQREAAEKSSQSSSGQAAALHELGNVSSPDVNHEEQYKPYLERGYNSPGDMSDFVNPKASANAKKTQFHKSPKGSNGNGGDAVMEEAVEEVLSPSVRQKTGIDAASNQGAMVSCVGERLDFGDEYGEALALVDGDNSSSFFESDSILAARPNDTITLQILKKGEVVDVETTMSDLLKPVEVADVSNDLTSVKLFFQYLTADTEERVDKVKKLKKRYPAVKDDQLADHLQSEAIAAFSRVPDFLLNLVRQSKYDKSALTRYVKGTQDVFAYMADLEQQNIKLKKKTVSLNEDMMSAFSKFNSAFSVFGLTLQKASDFQDGTLITQAQKTYSKLRDDYDQLRENYTQIASLNAKYADKRDEDHALIKQLENEKRELVLAANEREIALRAQLESANARESAWKLREVELLDLIKTLPGGRKALGEKSVKASGTAFSIKK